MTEVLARMRKSKSGTAEVRVTRSMYRGRSVAHVRVWYIPDGQSEYVPTRRGFSFDAGQLPELLAVLDAALRGGKRATGVASSEHAGTLATCE